MTETLNDLQRTFYLNFLSETTGMISDLQNDYLLSILNKSSGATNDMILESLQSFGVSATNINDAWRVHLSAFGFDTENLNDDLYSYYKSEPRSFTLSHNIIDGINNITPVFTRSTTGTVVDFEGVIHTTKINESRFSGARRVENLLTYSEDLSQNWIDASISIGSRTVENNNIILQEFIDVAVDTSHRILQNISDLLDDTEYVFSVYAKADDLKWLDVRVRFKNGTQGYQLFDLENGTKGTTYNNIISSKIEDVGNDVYRCSIVVNLVHGVQVPRLFISLRNGDNQSTYMGNNDSLFFGGVQLEQVKGTQTEASEYVSTDITAIKGTEIWDDDFSIDTSGDYGVTSDTVISYNSTDKAMRVTINTTDNNKGCTIGNLKEIGKNYRITFRAKGNRTEKFYSIGNNADLSSQVTIKNPTITSSWQEYEFIFLATDTYMRFYIKAGASGEYFDIDNIVITEELYHGANVDGVKYFNTDRSNTRLSESTLKGYLNEPESTNLLTYSEDIGDGSWGDFSGGVTKTGGNLAPDSSNTAYEIAQIDSGSDAIQKRVTLVGDTKYTLSFLIKNKNSTQSRIYIYDNNASTTVGDLIINWSGQTPSIATDTFSNLKHEELNNNWWKFSGVITTNATVTTHRILNRPESSATATNGVYFWGVQIEESPFPTSYIKTEAATVTRTADLLTVNNTTRKILPNSFALVGTYIPLGTGTDYGYARFFGTQDSRGNNYEMRTYSISSAAYYTDKVGGGSFYIDKADLNQLIPNKYAFQVIQDGSDVNAKIYKDGVQKLSEVETQTLDHSNKTLEIGSWNNDVFASNIKDVKIFKKELTDTQLKSVTE